MGILAPALAAPRAPWSDYWYEPRGYGSGAGAVVTPETALGIPAVYAATGVISEDIAKVPLHVFEELGTDSDGRELGKRKATQMPLEDLLHDQPNPYQTAIEFREMMTAFALLRKFGVAEIVPGPRGPVDQIVPLHPDLVREESTASGRRYMYSDPRQNFTERELLADEVFVLRGRFGRSVLDFARESLGLDILMERHAAALFTRGSTHSGVVSHPGRLSDPARTNIEKGLDKFQVGGAKAGRPLLLEEGMTWQNVSVTSKDAEFLESRKFGIRQVSRWFRVPPHKLADLENATFTNIEQQSIDYVTDTLLAWAIRWEQAIRRDLIIAKGRFFAEHNLDGLLRGDSAARSAAYALAINWGWMTRNEVRAKENLNPLTGLDDPLTPLNMQQVQQPMSTAARGHLRLLAADAASRIVRREMAAVAKLAERTADDQGGWRAGVEAIYGEHALHVAAALHVPEHVARTYARDQRNALLAAGCPSVMEEWPIERVAHLTDLAMDQEAIAA